MSHEFSPVIVGEFIYLSKVSEDDAELIYTWRTGESGKFLKQPKNYSVESQIKWIKNRTDDECYYMIHDKASGKKVGMVGIHNLSWDDLTGSVGGLILDEIYVHKSTPYGLEALLLTYGYFFNNLKFRKLHGNVLVSNDKIVGLQRYLGMKMEGELWEHVQINGEYENLILFALFKDDFPAYSSKINDILNKFR